MTYRQIRHPGMQDSLGIGDRVRIKPESLIWVSSDDRSRGPVWIIESLGSNIVRLISASDPSGPALTHCFYWEVEKLNVLDLLGEV